MRGGRPLIGIGLVWAIVAGALAFAVNIPAARYLVTIAGIDGRIAFAVIALGGLGVAAYGAWLRFGSGLTGQKRARNDAQVIYRSMLALAGVDGDLHPDELLMIQRCCQQFFQRNMSLSEIRKAFAHRRHINYAGFAFHGADQRASPEACVWAYTAAIMVAGADGSVSEAERAKLDRLAGLLGLDPPIQTKAAEEA